MGYIVVVTAPSGSGKTTIIKKYREKNSKTLFSISHTTRAKRPGEEDGVDYYFVDKTLFSDMIQNRKFVEWAEVHGNYYGTSVDELQKAEGDNILILDLDVQGALALKKLNIDALYIFIKASSIDVLKERLLKRQTETEESIKLRVWNAKRELEYEKVFDVIVLNDDIEKAQNNFESSIYEYIENKNKKKGDLH